MDATHKTNWLVWLSYTILVRDEQGIWLLVAHFLTQGSDGDIVAEALITIKKWVSMYTTKGVSHAQGLWNLKYMLTDDSAAEQKAVKIAFRGLLDGEMEVTHPLCRVHGERTLRRRLAGDKCKHCRKHLLAALKFRKTSIGCDESIKSAIDAAPENGIAKYILERWWPTRAQRANYAREHSSLLLQVSCPFLLVSTPLLFVF